jgi:hypothetical protein
MAGTKPDTFGLWLCSSKWREALLHATITIQETVPMAARQVILYFDDQSDALRFVLAAGSVMAGETQSQVTGSLVQEMQRACRVRLDEATEPAAG